jgi:large subunit ribosomal protein L24
MLKIKKGDTVKVIAGKDKDKEGKVIAVNAKKNTVTVEGINMVTNIQNQVWLTRQVVSFSRKDRSIFLTLCMFIKEQLLV